MWLVAFLSTMRFHTLVCSLRSFQFSILHGAHVRRVRDESIRACIHPRNCDKHTFTRVPSRASHDDLLTTGLRLDESLGRHAKASSRLDRCPCCVSHHCGHMATRKSESNVQFLRAPSKVPFRKSQRKDRHSLFCVRVADGWCRSGSAGQVLLASLLSSRTA